MERELAFPEFAFVGYPLASVDTGDGVVWERDRCEAFPIESDTMFIESKVKIVKAVLLPMLGQVIGVVWHHVQEEARLYVVWAASVPDVM